MNDLSETINHLNEKMDKPDLMSSRIALLENYEPALLSKMVNMSECGNLLCLLILLVLRGTEYEQSIG